ncbi:MAG TPA: cytochrome b [Caulobacteraceae bacterium]|nr:cytochrome b [Caulobacteraceae bacterium]
MGARIAHTLVGAPRATTSRRATSNQRRYSPANQAMHWVTALCMFAILPLAWVMTNAKHGTQFDEALFNWHKTLGIIVLLVTLVRVIWRFVDGPPPYPEIVAAWDRRLAHAAYWLFFAALIWMPVTGYLSSIYGAHPPSLFNLLPTPQAVAPDKAMAGLFTQLHNAGQWAIYALIALHLSAVAFHLIWGHTGVLGRMLPANAAEPAAREP